MTRTDIRTPMATTEAVELGNRVWRKQVLPVDRGIDYGSRRLEFTRDYLDAIASAFQDGAFDTVPFVLADADNRHTMDPERARGEVLGMDVDADGLYATVRLSETAEQLVRDNPRLGVSVRIKENYDRPDGRTYRAACQHVLGTFDPRVTGLKRWSEVELSQTHTDDVIDLSGLTFNEAAPDEWDLAAARRQEDMAVRSLAAAMEVLGVVGPDEETAVLLAAQEIAEGDPAITSRLLDTVGDAPNLRRELIQRAAAIDHEEFEMSQPADHDDPAASTASTNTQPTPHEHRVNMANQFFANMPSGPYEAVPVAGKVAYPTEVTMPGTHTNRGVAEHPGAALDRAEAATRAAHARITAMSTTEKAEVLSAQGGWVGEKARAIQRQNDRVRALDDIARSRPR